MTVSSYGHMVHEYLVARHRQYAAERAERLARLSNRRQALAYRDEVRRKLANIFGPWPRRTPLRPHVTGVVERPRYRIEKVYFESRPGYFVTANLYVPHGKPPFPAVLGCCGHAENGKASGSYQTFSRTLAEHGYIVLLWDPVSQGERGQFVGLRDRPRPGCVREHLITGKQLSLVGESFPAWHVWDGVRALDYLLSRPEVDRRHVGVTGNSGGGTLATYLSALDDRYTMAAPSCFVTTYLSNVENELPGDNEQVPPGIVAAGLDQADFFIAQAPRPTLLLGQHNDFFDERGLKATFEQVRRFYGLVGAADRVRLHIGPGVHGFQRDARRAMYRFFNNVVGRGNSDREPVKPIEPDKVLWATPRGSVAHLPGHRFIHDFTREIADRLARSRRRMTDAVLRRALTRVLALPRRPAAPCHYRVLRPMDVSASRRWDSCWRLTVETEPGIQVMLRLWEAGRPATEAAMRSQLDPDRNIVVYVPHLSSDDDLFGRQCPLRPPMLWTIDPRGMGPTLQTTCLPGRDPMDNIGVEYACTAWALMLGESYLGRRVHDVLATLDLLESRGAQRVHLMGRGVGAIIAAFAGCLHPLVRRVTLRHAPRSFHELARTPWVRWPMSCLPWGVLRSFDLPDCYRLLRAKGLRLIDPWGAAMK